MKGHPEAIDHLIKSAKGHTEDLQHDLEFLNDVLTTASSHRQKTVVEKMLKLGASFGCIDVAGYLSSDDDADKKWMCNLIYEHGASPSAWTPCIALNKTDVIKWLIEKGRSPYDLDPACKSIDAEDSPSPDFPLAVAARYAAVDVLKVMLEAKTNKAIDEKSMRLNSALLDACNTVHPEAVRTLLAHGARAGGWNEQGLCPLLVACACVAEVGPRSANPYIQGEQTDAPAVVKLLLEHPSFDKHDFLVQWMHIDDTTFATGTALHITVARSNKAVVKLLIDAGADVNATSTRNETPLMWFFDHNTLRQDQDILEMLLKKGADPNKRNTNGETPLFVGAHVNNAHLYKKLLEAGGDPDAGAEEATTPLLNAVAARRVDIVSLLVYYNCNVNNVGDYTNTPHDPVTSLALAAKKYQLEQTGISEQKGALPILNIILAAGCDKKGAAKLLRQMKVLKALHTDAVHDALVEFLYQPTRLKHMCRLLIRKQMGRRIVDGVSKLNLPEPLPVYVLLKDVMGSYLV